MSGKYDYTIKISVLGDSLIGKTSLLHRYCDDLYFPKYKQTIGIDFRIKRVQLDDKKVILHMWDIPQIDNLMSDEFYKCGNIVLLMYDVGNKCSFQNIDKYKKQLLKYRTDQKFILVGNKTDIKING